MGNCLRNTFERLSRKREYEKSIVILTLGLDNAGKTLILKQICGDPDKNVLPTMGFRKLSLRLANKQDLSGAVDEIDLVENLEVEHLVNAMKCPTRVETCSCVYGPAQEKGNTAGIMSGYKWLLDSVHKNYSALNSRVKRSQSHESTNHDYKSHFLMDISPKSTFRSDPFIPIRDLLLKEAKTEADNTNHTPTGIKSGRMVKSMLVSRNKTAPCPSGDSINKLDNSVQAFTSVTNNIKKQKTTEAVELILSPEQLCFNRRTNFARPYTAPGRSESVLQTVTVDNIPGQVPY